MAMVSVTQAAQRLGVAPQRVRQLIASGTLPATKVGSSWVIKGSSLRQLKQRSRPGRPLSERSAWMVIAAADGHEILDELSAPDRSKARARVREVMEAIDRLKRTDETEFNAAVDRMVSRVEQLLRNRAERRRYRVSPRDLSDLREDSRLALSGVSAANSEIAASDIVEAYVSHADLQRIVDEFLLVAVDGADTDANVVLHVISPTGPRRTDIVKPEVPPLLLAADLLEHRGPRERAAALRALQRMRDSHQRPASGDKDG